MIITIIIKDIYHAPDLSRNMTALGAYNSKVLLNKIHQYTHPHPHTHMHNIIYTERKKCQRDTCKRLEAVAKETSF